MPKKIPKLISKTKGAGGRELKKKKTSIPIEKKA